MQGENLFTPRSLDELQTFLTLREIDTETWGTGVTKSLKDLYRELIKPETELVVNPETGELLRILYPVNIDVFFIDAQRQVLKLIEDRQVFPSGSIRKRKTYSSIAEKRHIDEDEKAGLERALNEELGISDNYEIAFETREEYERSRDSESYPGLKTVYKGVSYRVYLSLPVFNPDGYVEHEESTGITTYFRWELETGEMQ